MAECNPVTSTNMESHNKHDVDTWADSYWLLSFPKYNSAIMERLAAKCKDASITINELKWMSGLKIFLELKKDENTVYIQGNKTTDVLYDYKKGVENYRTIRPFIVYDFELTRYQIVPALCEARDLGLLYGSEKILKLIDRHIDMIRSEYNSNVDIADCTAAGLYAAAISNRINLLPHCRYTFPKIHVGTERCKRCKIPVFCAFYNPLTREFALSYDMWRWCATSFTWRGVAVVSREKLKRLYKKPLDIEYLEEDFREALHVKNAALCFTADPPTEIAQLPSFTTEDDMYIIIRGVGVLKPPSNLSLSNDECLLLMIGSILDFEIYGEWPDASEPFFRYELGHSIHTRFKKERPCRICCETNDPLVIPARVDFTWCNGEEQNVAVDTKRTATVNKIVFDINDVD